MLDQPRGRDSAGSDQKKRVFWGPSSPLSASKLYPGRHSVDDRQPLYSDYDNVRVAESVRLRHLHQQTNTILLISYTLGLKKRPRQTIIPSVSSPFFLFFLSFFGSSMNYAIRRLISKKEGNSPRRQQ